MSSVQFPRHAAFCSVVAVTFVAAASAVEPSSLEFSRDVQPILTKHCFVCHGPDEGSRHAGLRLDLRLAATAELESGAVAILPGQQEASELFRRIMAKDADMRMPPAEHGNALSLSDVKTLTDWIAAGAAYDDHWSFRRLRKVEPPAVKDEAWVRNPIDRFILARLESEGLTPSLEADRATLLRRLSLDLAGLPPTPAEVAEFQTDDSQDAYERTVDRLLASPHFGERWGRHWLDLAHYADSDGYLNDDIRPHA
jgi:hypothetical protein